MSPTVQFSKPSDHLFQFPPSRDPITLPPPLPGSINYAPPFAISAELYNGALDARVPITIAITYAVSVFILNAYNRNHGNQPWAISKTKAFFAFVVLHNVFLAAFSGWTLLGMWGTLQRSLVSPFGNNGLAGTVDTLCKIHGPRGLGHAVTFSPQLSEWTTQANQDLDSIAAPQSTDIGRIWNEGLAFYGWLFYLSKFYEVLDTFIIVAKGKRSATLQTYHHAGAMLCMWSGIRFMSPPIWMFVLVNSAIHTLMYTYYTLTAFSVPISQSLKRSLTTLQIMQFLVGSSYAALHSFISYSIPVEVSIIESKIKRATSLAAATPTGFADSLKGVLLRSFGQSNDALALPPVSETTESTVYQTEYQTITCLDTSGETFAIWLNVFYLTPLTFLFMRFFVKSYLRRSTRPGIQARHVKDHANSHVKGNGKAE